MSVFLVWIAVSALILIAYMSFLWRRARIQSRFRAKLTTIFLLFVLIPTIPLTFFIASLMTRSADLLLVPGIGEALNTSLETIKQQVEERGRRFLEEHKNPNGWSTELLEAEGIHAVGCYRLAGDSIVTIRRLHLPASPLFREWTPRPESIIDVMTTGRSSSIVRNGGERAIVVFRVLSDSTVAMVEYPVSSYVLDAREEVERAYGIYSTLSLIKESIIQKNIIWALAVILVVGLAVLSIITARTISQGISEPMQNLVSGMSKVAEGDLSVIVETEAKDEFRFLVDSFNKMTRDLKVSRQKLLKAERLAAWQSVARQISHEIKNSLTPVSISLRRLRNHFQDQPLPKSISESLQAVEDELRSLEGMAKEFSEFARMPQPRKSEVDVNRVVRSVVHLLKPSCGRVNFKMNLQEELSPVQADGEQIKRLVGNIMRNAAEASHDTGNVTISTRRLDEEQHCVEIEVKDDGEGMDEETLAQIFHPYYTTKKKGTGLGLVIVQKIVEDHDGEIAVESEKGKGTRVVVRL